MLIFLVVLETKKRLIIFYSPVGYIPKQLLSKSFSRNKVSYCLGLFIKRLRGAHILVKLQAYLSRTLQ